MNIFVSWIVMAIAIVLSAYVLPGVTVSGFITALMVALVLGLVNAFIRPLVLVLTLPINILTLGLFTLVINALMIMLVSYIVPGFKVDGFWYALLFSIVLALVLYVLHMVEASLSN
ncbi:MAG: phage holin family protein [Candidatus Pacebacteria bacterium]|jgi:putative membrane protein|nr:phage holin family protein [Candidatus Paceibacterota bacterium]